MSDFVFDDGAELHVGVADGKVSVFQGSGSTQGRGAAFLSADQADELADALHAAAGGARGETEHEEGAASAEASPDHLPLGEQPVNFSPVGGSQPPQS